MRVFWWAAVAMTVTVVAVTLYEAAFGDEIARVVIGLAVSIAGIFVVALTEERRSR